MRITGNGWGWTWACVLFVFLLALTACGGNNASNGNGSGNDGGTPPANGDSGEKKLDPVNLVWYYPETAIQADLAEVQAAVNKITKEKINATVELKVVPFSEYNDKMNTVLAAGEKFDLIWTSNWNFNYVENQAKGAFVELDQLIDQYAPEVKSNLPSFVWDATRVKGKIYGVPNYQTVTNREGFVIQKRLIDKYHLDVSKIKKIEDIEPFLQTIKENEPDLVPFPEARGGPFMTHYYGFEIIADSAGIRLSDPTKIINIDDTPEKKQYLELTQRWMKNGWVNNDAAVIKTIDDIKKSGKAAVSWHNVLKPGGEAEVKVAYGGVDAVYVPLTDAFASTGTITTTMQAISRTSENPERAMMLINLVNTDQDLYRLLSYGIKDKHYTINADGTMKVNADSGYSAADWVFGNVFNGYVLEGKDPNVFQQTMEENQSATPSPIIGFNFDVDPVSAELANLKAVGDEFGPGLETGSVDLSKYTEAQEKKKKAGMDRLITEMQKQLDAWNAAK